MIKIPIIYEDSYYLIIDKPHNLVVNRSLTTPEDTLQDWLQDKYSFAKPKLSQSDFLNRTGIVHRLDKDTSGLMIIAKTEDAFNKLQKQFFLRTVKKEYLALVYGEIGYSTGQINVPLGRMPANRRKFAAIPSGRDALTEFALIKIFQIDQSLYSLLKVTPLTGRTHQIRVHLKYLGYPVVGDKLYAERSLLRLTENICKRLFLHCTSIVFQHPNGNFLVNYKSQIPPELQEVLNKI